MAAAVAVAVAVAVAAVSGNSVMEREVDTCVTLTIVIWLADTPSIVAATAPVKTDTAPGVMKKRDGVSSGPLICCQTLKDAVTTLGAAVVGREDEDGALVRTDGVVGNGVGKAVGSRDGLVEGAVFLDGDCVGMALDDNVGTREGRRDGAQVGDGVC